MDWPVIHSFIHSFIQCIHSFIHSFTFGRFGMNIIHIASRCQWFTEHHTSSFFILSECPLWKIDNMSSKYVMYHRLQDKGHSRLECFDVPNQLNLVLRLEWRMKEEEWYKVYHITEVSLQCLTSWRVRVIPTLYINTKRLDTNYVTIWRLRLHKPFDVTYYFSRKYSQGTRIHMYCFDHNFADVHHLDVFC